MGHYTRTCAEIEVRCPTPQEILVLDPHCMPLTFHQRFAFYIRCDAPSPIDGRVRCMGGCRSSPLGRTLCPHTHTHTHVLGGDTSSCHLAHWDCFVVPLRVRTFPRWA